MEYLSNTPSLSHIPKDSAAIAEIASYLSRNNEKNLKFQIEPELKSLDLDGRAEELFSRLDDLDLPSLCKSEHIAEVNKLTRGLKLIPCRLSPPPSPPPLPLLLPGRSRHDKGHRRPVVLQIPHYEIGQKRCF
jgi:hypothetical protein